MKFDVLIYIYIFFFSWNEENLYVKYKDRSVYSPSLSMPGPPNHRVAMFSTALNPLPFKYVCTGNTLRLSRPSPADDVSHEIGDFSLLRMFVC